MRNATCERLIDLYSKTPFVFLTGDLGFQALEPLQKVMGEHFINAGIAEQNMVSVAAGLAYEGMDVWVYSIAPFCYARPFEQIRNDVCLHNMPVKLIGNGGGYAYGVMGASHHALEDYGVLMGLQNMHIFVPAFSEDLGAICMKMSECPHPSYLRLGKCEKPESFNIPNYAPWRKLVDGAGSVVLTIGPFVGGLIAKCIEIDEERRPEIWSVTELQKDGLSLPKDFLESVRRKKRLIVAEEHVAQGGLGQIVSLLLLQNGIQLDSFEHICAMGYPSGTYGSQVFHRAECGLTPEQILERVGVK